MKQKLNPILELFSFVKIVMLLAIVLVVSTVYLYLITKQLPISITLGFVSMFFSFYFLIYLPERLNREQYLLKDLQKYATSMTFYLQAGYNVLQSMNLSKQNLDEQIKRDIEKTMIKLERKAELDTSHFKKYRFTSLDIFHQILEIKYKEGGEAKKLFARVNESINFELVKRDELYRRKKAKKNSVLLMIVMVAAVPLLLAFLTKDIYDKFLSMGMIAIAINCLLFVMLLISLFFLQKNATNISIYD